MSVFNTPAPNLSKKEIQYDNARFDHHGFGQDFEDQDKSKGKEPEAQGDGRSGQRAGRHSASSRPSASST